MAVATAVRALPDHRPWLYWGLVAITVAFGFETLRALLSLLVYVLREGYGWDAVQVGILALVIFSTGFQAGPLTRRLGPSTTLGIAAAGVGLTRLFAQLWTFYPLVDLGLTVAGTFFFILFLFALVEHSRNSVGIGTASSGLAFLLGVSLDTFILGAFDTWGPFWRIGVGPTWAASFMFMTQFFCGIYTVALGRSSEPATSEQTEETALPPPASSLPWLAIGPLIFLQLQLFQNLAGFAAATGWTLPQAFLLIIVSNAVGLLVAAGLASRPSLGTWVTALLFGIVLTIAVSLTPDTYSPTLAAALLVGNACLSGLLIIIFSGLDSKKPETRHGEDEPKNNASGPGGAFYGIGMILLMALLFGYYASLELEMPFSREMLLPAAGVIIGLAALWASFASQRDGVSYFPMWRPAAFAAIFSIAPLVMWVMMVSQPLQPETGSGYPVRVMTYNLHNGFNTDGRLDPEHLAEVIEYEKPDILALQEVSRGWIINGSVDMLLWLSGRLDMPYLYGPSTGHMWGNAILSRFPVSDWGTVDLPPRDLPLLRQLTWADFDLGEGQELRVIATHFHHPEEGGEERLLQTEAVLSFWDVHPQTIVMADLNADPDWPEMLGFWRAGFSDALEGVEDRATFPSYEPVERIDYILASHGLELSDPSIVRATASDHLPVTATVDLNQSEPSPSP